MFNFHDDEPRDIAQLEECLPSMHEASRFNPKHPTKLIMVGTHLQPQVWEVETVGSSPRLAWAT